MIFNPERHHRKSIRLKGYDYSRAGLYFITMCSYNNLDIFGEIHDGIMKLNAFGDIIKEEWEKTPSIRKNIALGEYIVMPNHFHGIIEILEKIAPEKKSCMDELQFTPTTFKSPSQNIGAIIRGFKGASTKRIKNLIRNRRGELQFAPIAPTAPTVDLSKSIWQRDYYERIIKTDKAYQNIKNYIINNPVRANRIRPNTPNQHSITSKGESHSPLPTNQ